MKFLINIIFIIIITIMTVIFPSVALAATLSLSPSTGTFNKGCQFSVNIDLDATGADSNGTDAILNYDPSRLSATQVLNGTIYSEYPGSNIDSRNGKITVTGLTSASSSFSGNGTLATVNFTVLDSAQVGATQLTFDFDPQDRSKTTDSNVIQKGTIADVLTGVTNGSYTIGSGSCTSQGTTGTKIIYIGTPSGQPQTGTTTTKGGLPNAGTTEFTAMIVIIGGILTILGMLGLAIL